MDDRTTMRGSWTGRNGRGLAAALGCALMLLAAGPAAANPKLVFDIHTGEVLYAEQADDLWYPASITKLMTAYVALTAVREGRIAPDTLLFASPDAVAEPPSKIGIAEGQSITLLNALRLLLVKSANDIAVVVAEGVSGSVEAFADEMNAAAERLGMSRTRFVNPHGLPDERNVTTARDMAILTRALALEFPESARLTRLPFIKMGDSTIRSHNDLIGRYAGADGMKTGFICAAGFNIVASATRRGERIAAVVLGELTPDHRRVAVEKLLDYGFAAPRDTDGSPLTLATMPRRPAADEPVNMRPAVCGQRVDRSDLPERRPFVWSGPAVDVFFGADLAAAPLPEPRPAGIDALIARTAPDELGLVTALAPEDPVAARARAVSEAALAGQPAVPLPIPRPEETGS